MKEEVFNYLHDYGFTAIDINKIEVNDKKTNDIDISTVRKNIKFLEDKYLNEEEIIELICKNTNMLYVNNEQIENIENILDSLSFDYMTLHDLIISYPNLYTINYNKFKEIIDYISSKVSSKEDIKKLLISSPNILDLNLDKVKEII